MKRVRTMTAIGVGLALLAAACAGPSEGSTNAAAPADLTAALAGLCRAADQARAGDLLGARRTFQNRAHAFLHELAGRADEQARPAVARLLQAKQRVETRLGRVGETPAEVEVLLVELETATRELAGALGTPAPRCGGAGR